MAGGATSHVIELGPAVVVKRLLALYWFLAVLSEDPARPRNPSGTAARQAERPLALLGG
jgi:hypothetical protein